MINLMYAEILSLQDAFMVQVLHITEISLYLIKK